MARTGAGIGGFVLAATFVWLVFDNLALGLLFGLVAAGGGIAMTKNKEKKA